MSKRFYTRTSGKTTEPDMRQELDNTFDGVFPEVAKAQKGLIRKMRRDTSGNKIQCACVDILTHEPDLDHFCPYCHGEGYIWDEEWVDFYKVVLRSDVGLAGNEDLIKSGNIKVQMAAFYLRGTAKITEDDKIIELVTDRAGDPVRPYRREHLYRITTALDFRSDHGKLEYWKLDCYEEKRKFLNGLVR